MFNQLRTRIKLYQLRSYIRKKLAYHEAGHLIFSYLLKIPCKSIVVKFDFVAGIQFQDGYAMVEMSSDSQVESIIPLELQRMLLKANLGIADVAAEIRRTVRETQQLYHKYFVILLSGRLSEEHFAKSFCNDDLDYLQKAYSKDLMERNLNEDIERFNYLNKSLYPTMLERKNTFETARAIILHYLKQAEIIQAIHLIASRIKGNKKLDRATIEELLSKNGFLDYCTTEYQAVIKRL